MKPWETPQRPNTDRGRTDRGGGGGTKTHPPPDKPGSNRLMAVKARRDKAQRRRRTQRWRRQREPAEQGTRPNTPLTQLLLQPKATCNRVVSTEKRRRRRQWEAKPERGLCQKKTAMGPQDTEGGPSGRRGGTKTPEGRARSGTQPTERRRRGPPPNGRARLMRAADEGGKGKGEPPPSSARPWRAARDQEGTPGNTSKKPPPRGGHQDPEGAPSKLSERRSPTAEGRR